MADISASFGNQGLRTCKRYGCGKENRLTIEYYWESLPFVKMKCFGSYRCPHHVHQALGGLYHSEFGQQSEVPVLERRPLILPLIYCVLWRCCCRSFM